MTARAMASRLRGAVFLLAFVWVLPARALPDDREARAPRWAAADLACAASDALVPGCRDKAYNAVELGNSGELLRGYLRRAAQGARQTPSSTASAQARPTAQTGALAKDDDLTLVIHALCEVVAAMGLDARADILLAFASRPVAGAPAGDHLDRAQLAGFPFGVLLGWSTTLSGIYQSAGARFDQVLFNTIDPQRLVAWNSITPESARESATVRAPTGSLGGPGIESPYLWGRAAADLAAKAGEPGEKAARKKRTIIYMERGRTTVMTVDDATK
jgi:hypothetical protein